MTDVELKPCPFCGARAEVIVLENVGVSVRCTNMNCGCQTVSKHDKLGLFDIWPEKTALEEVIKRWNSRAQIGS